MGADGRTAPGEPPAVLGEMNGAGPVAGGTIYSTASDGGRTGMEGAVERLQPIRVGRHIGVDEGEEVAGGRLGGEVAGGVGAEGLRMVMTAGLGVAVGNVGAGRVAGGAVDNDGLPIGERLAVERFQTSVQGGGRMKARDNDGESWRHGTLQLFPG